MNELLAKQQVDRLFQHYIAESHNTSSVFRLQDNDILVREYPLGGAVQMVVLESLQPKVLYLAHYSLLAGQTRGSKTYESLRHSQFWTQMANDVFQSAK